MRGNERIPEIDYLRTLAICLMVIFHFVYDLDHYTALKVDVTDPWWTVVGRAAAILFMVISGVSNGFSRRPIRRGLKVLGWGMVVTLATFIVMPETYVRFGILHFLGISMILYPLVRRLSPLAISALCVLSFVTGYLIRNTVLPFPWLLPLGISYPGFATIDYYPLFPYLGFSFLGILGYKLFYGKGKRLFPRLVLFPEVAWVSRNSLGIYLIHQPVLLAAIFLVQHFLA